jgi:hypothetical protein
VLVALNSPKPYLNIIDLCIHPSKHLYCWQDWKTTELRCKKLQPVYVFAKITRLSRLNHGAE